MDNRGYDDQRFRDVLDQLEFQPGVNAAHIGVTANKGVVTLNGFVMSYAERAAAERAAWRVKRSCSSTSNSR